ncbi:MAG: DUF2975 domain-containing protein [Legionellales bacterium]|nr:DUF2975 domain-containing protein [Legionellales bacterium]
MKALCKTLSILFMLMMLVLPALILSYWATFSHQHEFSAHWFQLLTPNLPVYYNPTWKTKLLAVFVSLPNLMIMVFILYHLSKLFKLYANDIIFTLQNVSCIKRIAVGLLLSELIYPFYQIAISLVLTLPNPNQAQRFIWVYFSPSDVLVVIIALVTFVVAWVMGRACQLQEEQALTI